MSGFKKAPLKGGPPPRNSVFASLRETQIVNSKPLLPAEILSQILDYLPPPCLLRFARVSKRMQEMVYDDTRWVQRLQLMGCWNEGEARRRRAETLQKKLGVVAGSGAVANGEIHLRGGEGRGGGVGGGGDGGPTGSEAEREKGGHETLFDATSNTPEQLQTNGGAFSSGSGLRDLHDGFDAIDLVPLVETSPQGTIPTPSGKRRDSTTRLTVFQHVISVRGHARREYGKIYSALSPFYTDAVQAADHRQARVFRTYRDPDQQAQMLSNLTRFSNSDMAEGWWRRQEKLAGLVSAFEKAVAQEFQQAIEARDVQGKMRKYAHVLTSLDGGTKAVEMIIETSPAIMRRSQFGDPVYSLDGMGDYSYDKTYDFFAKLSTAFNEQVEVIDQIFPAPVDAVTPFLRTVGKVVIAEYLTTAFDEAHRVHLESYLKSIAATCGQSLEWARTLQPTSSSGDEFYETLDQVLVSIFDPHIDLYLTEELSWFKKKSDAEVTDWERQLSEQDATMESMFMSNVNRQADKRDFLTSFKKVVMMPVNVLPTFPMSSPFGGKPAVAKALVNGENLNTVEATKSNKDISRTSSPSISNGTALSANRPLTPLPEPPTTELAAKAAIMNSRLEGIRSLFSIEVALNLVHFAKSSIERTATFTKLPGARFTQDARVQCELIFISLLQTLGNRHIQAGFDQAVDHLSNYKPRKHARSQDHQPPNNNSPAGVTPLITFLELVNVGDLIQQMLDVFYEQELVATKLTDRNDFLNPAVKEKKRFESMLDSRVAAGLNKGIEVLMDEVEFVCATTQKPKDFNPDGGGFSSSSSSSTGGSGSSRSEKSMDLVFMDIGISATAEKVVDLLSSHTKMLTGSTDKTMLDVFNQEVGMRLFTCLCKHIKRQRVSVAGSLKLIADMTHYFSYIVTLKNKELLQFFVALRELAQIYLVDPGDAKALAQIVADGERFRGVFRAEEVLEFCERRADWYVIRGRLERSLYGIGCSVM